MKFQEGSEIKNHSSIDDNYPSRRAEISSSSACESRLTFFIIS